MDKSAISGFQEIVLSYYHAHGRHDLPWRIADAGGYYDPYKILVSEFMLQQTQVPRVIPKFTEFLQQFPTLHVLADARLSDVLIAWNGLGYNRRAKYLHQTAQSIAHQAMSHFPTTIDELVQLPGVGKNTAAAILAYAFNQPVVFVETNIRSVYIYHFFASSAAKVTDAQILDFVEQTLDSQSPRDWYWALMDYGTYLKRDNKNLNMLSKQYAKQSAFLGSRRQIRGRIIRELTTRPQRLTTLQKKIVDERLSAVLMDLVAEGFIRAEKDSYRLA